MLDFGLISFNFFWFASILVTVGELPCPDSSGRLLLFVKCSSEFSEASSSKRTKKASSYIVGTLTNAEVNSFSFYIGTNVEYI